MGKAVCGIGWAAVLAALASGAGNDVGLRSPLVCPSGAGDRAPYSRETPIVQVVKKTRAAVVQVRVAKQSRRDGSREIGAGVVVDERGYVVTNDHLLRSGVRDSVRVRLTDDTELAAEIVAQEPACDLAVLRVRADRPLVALTLGPAGDLEVGETLIAIGHPHGYAHTVSTGIVSALHRRIALPTGETLTGLIQTNASINPGNSGGPLLNINGELVGLNAAYYEGAQGIGFAISAETVKEVLNRHLNGAKVAGICHGLTCTERVRPEGPERQRLVVAAVTAQTPAARAGFQPGDEILRVGERRVFNPFDLERTLWDRKPGDSVPLTVVRQGKTIPVALTLAPAEKPTRLSTLAQTEGPAETAPAAAPAASPR
jgi:serine protease Do